MALSLTKTVDGTDYNLYIVINFTPNSHTDPITKKECTTVFVKAYPSKEQVGIVLPVVKKTEDIFGDDNNKVSIPLKYKTDKQKTDALSYIHQYIVTNIPWYAGAIVVD